MAQSYPLVMLGDLEVHQYPMQPTIAAASLMVSRARPQMQRQDGHVLPPVPHRLADRAMLLVVGIDQSRDWTGKGVHLSDSDIHQFWKFHLGLEMPHA